MEAIKIVGGTMYVYLKEAMKVSILLLFRERRPAGRETRGYLLRLFYTCHLPSFTQFKRFGLSGCRCDNLTLLQV